MKAAYYTAYGPPDVVSIHDIPKPQPKNNELLVKVMATAVTAADARIRAARFPKGFGVLARMAFGLSKPRVHVLGSCFSGTVEAVGKSVSAFQVGDEVCGMTGIGMGAHAEYLTISADKPIVKKPRTISHEDAAGILFGGTAALYFIRDRAKVQQGDTVLINGASGAVGTNAIQLANYFGGTVTGVTSGDNTELVTTLGAEHIIDYQKESFLDDQQTYDVILDAVGNVSIKRGVRLLSDKGRLVLMVASLGQILASTMRPNVLTGTAPEKKQDVEFLLSLLAEGKLRVVIDKVYALEDIADAYAHVDSGHKKGNCIIQITSS